LCAVLAASSPRHWRGAGFGPAGRSRCTLVREVGGSWVAHPLLADDPAARATDAPAVAAWIDRSPAVGVDGDSPDVDALLPHLTRAGDVMRFRKFVVPPQLVDWPPPDPRTRMASVTDLDELDALFGDYEVAMGRTQRIRRKVLRDAIARLGVIAVGAPGDIVAACVSEGATPTYLIWSHARVLPEHRGEGLSWALISRIAALFNATGLGTMMTLTDDNPVPVPEELGWVEQQCSVNLSLPDRVPGERAARLGFHRLERWWDTTTTSRPR